MYTFRYMPQRRARCDSKEMAGKVLPTKRYQFTLRQDAKALLEAMAEAADLTQSNLLERLIHIAWRNRAIKEKAERAKTL